MGSLSAYFKFNEVRDLWLNREVVHPKHLWYKRQRLLQGRVSFSLSDGDLTLKTATTRYERHGIYRLRHRVFMEEFAGKRLPSEMERDRYDRDADHLLILHKPSQQVVGTYRMICSQFSEDYYSRSEFDLSGLDPLRGIKVELSRACIHPQFRNGRVISLLWRGIYRYLMDNDADYLFGCSSIKLNCTSQLARVVQFLRQAGKLCSQVYVPPLAPFDVSSKLLHQLVHSPEGGFQQRQLPPLLRGYLNLGAQIAPTPAYDAAFDCYDFFTLLDVSDLSYLHHKRFQ